MSDIISRIESCIIDFERASNIKPTVLYLGDKERMELREMLFRTNDATKDTSKCSTVNEKVFGFKVVWVRESTYIACS